MYFYMIQNRSLKAQVTNKWRINASILNKVGCCYFDRITIRSEGLCIDIDCPHKLYSTVIVPCYCKCVWFRSRQIVSDYCLLWKQPHQLMVNCTLSDAARNAHVSLLGQQFEGNKCFHSYSRLLLSCQLGGSQRKHVFCS